MQTLILDVASFRRTSERTSRPNKAVHDAPKQFRKRTAVCPELFTFNQPRLLCENMNQDSQHGARLTQHATLQSPPTFRIIAAALAAPAAALPPALPSPSRCCRCRRPLLSGCWVLCPASESRNPPAQRCSHSKRGRLLQTIADGGSGSIRSGTQQGEERRRSQPLLLLLSPRADARRRSRTAVAVGRRGDFGASSCGGGARHKQRHSSKARQPRRRLHHIFHPESRLILSFRTKEVLLDVLQYRCRPL